MDFIETVEQIKSKYREASQEKLITEVNYCLLQGGTLSERFLILADWLTQLKDNNYENYNLAYEESESIIKGAKSFFSD
ncbi:hypothetical protein KRR40_45385 [Niabella defluvii]|nr:hypothetical protein KRR40_45385 [Niabella sp. I65]